VVVAGLTLALLSCAVPGAEAKLPKHEDRNVLCEACNATLVELGARVRKTEKKLGLGACSSSPVPASASACAFARCPMSLVSAYVGSP
jgi:hypothetical protein